MFPLDLLSDPVGQRLTWTLLHFVWQGLAVTIAVATLLYVWPVRRAQSRYLLYLSGLIGMAVCPLVTFMVIDTPAAAMVTDPETKPEVEGLLAPTPHVAPEPGPYPGPESATTDTHTAGAEPSVQDGQPRLDDLEAVPLERARLEREGSASLLVPVARETKPRRYIEVIQPYALAAWLAGVLLLAIRLSLSWLQVRWLAWGRHVIPADLAAKATVLSERLGLKIPPRVCISEKVREAIVVGLWRPLILLPASWLTQMTPDVLEAVIAHELAHVRRLDLWVNLLQRLVETFLFYHPAVWWLSRRVSVEREMCADELAVVATSKRLAYALALEQLGRLRLGQTAPQFGAGIGGSKMVLLNRVGNVLGLSCSNKRAPWWPVALLALAVPLAVWLASTNVHSSTENQTLAAELDKTELDKAELDRWVEKANSPVQSEFDAAVDALVAMGPEVAREMIPLLKTGRTDRLGLNVLERLAPEPSVQRILIDAVEEARPNRHPNVIHCGLMALGKSGNVAHADFMATFLEKHDLAAMSALATLGGERARDHLMGAFDQIPTERWFMLAQNLARLGDPAAVPELKKRLTQVELPPNDRFPPATVGAMTGAISALSGAKETFTTTEYCQGIQFRYPFDGPGLPKTFSVSPLKDHYVRLPNVDPQTEAGREAIWNALAEATEGPGFTIDGNEVVAFHGLKMVPLWPDGRPYPITLYDWLRRTSHQVLLDLVEQHKQTGRCAIPQGGLLVALDPTGRLYVLSLEKTSDQFAYNVTVMPQDPNMQLIPISAAAEDTLLTEIAGCTLNDLESETKDGSLNLSRGHLQQMTREKWRGEHTAAVLIVEFAENEIALAVPGAERFLLAEAGDAWEEPEKVLSLLKAAAKEEPTIAGHERLEQDGAIFHTFSRLSEGRKFAFAVEMPDGLPVAGMFEVQTVDRQAQTLRIRHRFLTTAGAQEIFAKNDMTEAGGPLEEVGPRHCPWSVTGTVTDEEGRPLEGVEIRASCGMGTLWPTGTSQSDAEGHYTLRFGPGIWTRDDSTGTWSAGLQAATIFASKPGCTEKNLCRKGGLMMADKLPLEDNAWDAKPSETVLPDKPYNLDFVMVPAATIEGELIDGEGKPIGEEGVTVKGQQMRPSTSVLAHGKTDKTGRFRFEGIPTNYAWWFTSENERRTDSFTFSEPGVYRVKLQLVHDAQRDTDVLRITSVTDPHSREIHDRVLGVTEAGDAGDATSMDISIGGRLLGIDGKPAAPGYRVTALPRAWSTQSGMMPTTLTDEQGVFTFHDLPDGPCDVAATSNPLTNQPNVRIEGIVLKRNEPVYVELSLEQKYHCAGRVTDAKGRPLPERNVLAIWRDPSGKHTYSSNTKTNAFGRFHFSSPFKVAARILVNGGGKLEPSEYREVENGREDADFQLSTEKGRVSEDLNPLGLDDDSNDTAAETPLPKMIGISEANAGQETAARRNPPPDADRPAPGGKDEDTAKIELKLGIDEVRTISVALGQSAVDIHNLCKPAKVYADDDPWLIAPAAGGGSYVFFFAAEGTPEAMRGRLDPSRDNLYAVLHYPTDSTDNGKFLLPPTMSHKTYGDFVTLKVPFGLKKAKAATVVSGMSTEEVKHLFSGATDHASEDHAVVFDSIYDDHKYLLLFTPEGDDTTHDPKLDKLSEVIYRHGDEPEAIYLLPRSKRGKPVAAEHRELLGIDASKSGTDKSSSSEKSTDTTPDNTSESELVTEANVAT